MRGPFVAAGLKWLWLERLRRAGTLAAARVALAYAAIIVGNVAVGSDLGGIGLACLMTLAIAGDKGLSGATNRYQW
jgi:hypothetical protein